MAGSSQTGSDGQVSHFVEKMHLEVMFRPGRSIVFLLSVSTLAAQLACSGSHAASVDAGVEAGGGAGGGGAAGGGAAGGGAGGSGVGPWCTLAAQEHGALTKIIDDAPWRDLKHVGGMAVDAQNRVYFEDTENVWLVDCQNVSTYLTLAEAAANLPPTVANRITDLDMDPDGLLYVAVSGSGSMANAVAAVVRSSAAHVAQPWLDVSNIDVTRMSVIARDRVAIINIGGLYTATPTAQTLVYANGLLENRDGCALQDLSAAPTGTFLYQPGCNGSPMYHGNVDGSGVATFTGFTPTIKCTARDPKGGFYILTEDCPACVFRIYHLPDGATDKAQATLVETTPTLDFQKRLLDDILAFEFCSMAAANDGSLYIQTFQQMWKVWP